MLQDELTRLLKSTFSSMEDNQIKEIVDYLMNPEGQVRMTSVEDMEDIDKEMLQPILPGVKSNRLLKAFQSK